MSQHSRSDQSHDGNHRQNSSAHQRTHVNARNHPESQNGNIQTESAMSGLSHHMDGLAIGSSQVASPGRTGTSVAGPGWRPPPTTLPNERSHVSSIPLPREMTPVGNRHQISNSPASSRRPPLPDGGGGTGSGRERGRRNSRTESNRRGSRSSSASGRAGSRDRLQRESPSKLEVSGRLLFIYTATWRRIFPTLVQ